MNKLYVALVHGPVSNKRGEQVTTSVTNLDIHDISRSCKTFGVARYFLITQFQAQHELVGRILGHWQGHSGTSYNPDRGEALGLAELAYSVEETIQRVTQWEGQTPLLAVTGAGFKAYEGEAKDLVAKLHIDKKPCLLLFGTGWGLHSSLVESADFRLAPIHGASPDGYNHLSVRSAVAIYLDRLATAWQMAGPAGA